MVTACVPEAGTEDLDGLLAVGVRSDVRAVHASPTARARGAPSSSATYREHLHLLQPHRAGRLAPWTRRSQA